jgi:3-hydroxybutyryl-CoA dehydratase
MVGIPSIAEYKWRDLSVGQQHQFQVLLSPELLNEFAACSGDWSPIHISNEEAISRGFKSRVAHGMLLGGLLSRFVGCSLPGRYAFLLSTNIKFHHPCLEGETVEVSGCIESLSEATKVASIAFTFKVNGDLRARATSLVSVQQ